MHYCSPQQLSKGIDQLCELRITTAEQNIFINAYHGQDWVYSVPKPTKVTISCPDEKDRTKINAAVVEIQDTGILRIPNNCQAQAASSIPISKLTGQAQYHIRTQPIIVPNITMVHENIVEPPLTHAKILLHTPEGLTDRHLRAIQELITEIEQALIFSPRQTSTALLTALALIAVIFVYIIFRYYTAIRILWTMRQKHARPEIRNGEAAEEREINPTA